MINPTLVISFYDCLKWHFQFSRCMSKRNLSKTIHTLYIHLVLQIKLTPYSRQRTLSKSQVKERNTWAIACNLFRVRANSYFIQFKAWEKLKCRYIQNNRGNRRVNNSNISDKSLDLKEEKIIIKVKFGNNYL